MKEVLILKLLYNGEIHSIKEICDKFELSKSTVKRKIACLRDTGIKIETIRGKNGGYILLEKIKYGKI